MPLPDLRDHLTHDGAAPTAIGQATMLRHGPTSRKVGFSYTGFASRQQVFGSVNTSTR
jgi:hypothetical protein